MEDVLDEEISFVGAVEASAEKCDEPLVQNEFPAKVLSSGLVSSPGYGVVDSGCGRTLVGRKTLEQLTALIKDKTKLKPR